MLDAVQLLLEGPAPYPCRLQLCSAFEALLTVEWIVREDSKRRAFLFWRQAPSASCSGVGRFGG